MTSIPVSSVVNVSISVGATFPSRKGFGILNIVTALSGVISRAERIRSYSSLAGVLEDWNASTEVAKAATPYFGQNPAPTALKVSTRYESDQPAELLGAGRSTTDLTAIQAVTNGSFTISMDGVSADITGLNFTTDTSWADVAATVETALQAVAAGAFAAATVIYQGNTLIVRTGTTGVTATVSYATPQGTGTDVSALLGLQGGQAVFANGIDGESIAESLSAINGVNDDWYGLLFTKEIRDAKQVAGVNAVEDAADWVQANGKAFFNTSNDINVLTPAVNTDIASVLSGKNLRRTMTTYSSSPAQYPSASVAGRAFTVNFSQPNSTITLKFKQLPGITAEKLTQNQKSTLDAKRANALILVRTSDMFAESYMADGSFFDELHGIDWLQNAIQTEVFGYVRGRATKVALTDKGVAALEQQVTRVCDQAVSNGLAAPGETIDGEFLPKGYKIITTPVAELPQSEVDARQYNGLSFVLLGAGSIHGVQISGIFER